MSDTTRAFRYYLGLTSADRARFHDPSKATEVIGAYLSALPNGPEGCTVLVGTGVFRGDSERMLVVYVSGISERLHAGLLTWLVETFQQDCVAYESAPKLRFHYTTLAVGLPQDAGAGERDPQGLALTQGPAPLLRRP